MKRTRKLRTILSMLLCLAMVLAVCPTAVHGEGRALIPTGQVMKFDLGSDKIGGTSVEGTKNWVKIIQNSNPKRLFENVDKGVNVAAVQVTFGISNWSGTEFLVTWGCNLNFIGDGGSTWCGTGAFEGISNYLIDREGIFTVTCDLAQLCQSQGKEGIEWLQTCEMVIDGVSEGDPTMIDVKCAYLYLPGETVPADNATPYIVKQVDTVSIDPSNVGKINDGLFQGWGTSLCWYGNRIGNSEQASDQAAQLLYNADTGLGLNIIRYNIGGGDDPTHTHIQRSDSNMPGYWTDLDEETGAFSYDFSQDAAQRNALLKSIKQCPDMLVEMFSNSAPYFMTRSGCTSGTTDEISSNLTIENMPQFAEYLATVVKHYVNMGINVVSIEPMNEPSNGWNVAHYGVKQEGCSIAKGEEQSAMITAMCEAMENHGLTGITLTGCDETNDTTTNQALSKLSQEAFSLLGQINTHTYSRNAASSEKLYATALDSGKNLWMSECDSGSIRGTDAGEMGAALNLAEMITSDLNQLQPSAWILWQAIGSYCDTENEFDPDTLSQSELDTNGFWGVCYADMNTETIVLTKKYYAFGQYTRYIRPGDYLIACDDSFTTAAYSQKDGQLKIVVYNTSDQDREINFDLSAWDIPGQQVNVTRTSGDFASGENWAKLDDLMVANDCLYATAKANSVTTFVVNGVYHDMVQEMGKEIAPANDGEGQAEVALTTRPQPSADTATGWICFTNSDWSYTVMGSDAEALTALSVSALEDGTYTLTLPAVEGKTINGTQVCCIDLMDFARILTGIDVSTLTGDKQMSAYHTRIAQCVKATVTSVTLDGEALPLDASKIVVDDTEENRNLRIELYNMYGPTAEEGAIDPDAISFSKEMTITFTLELAPIEAAS